MLLLQNAMTYWYPVDIAHILLCGKNLRFLYFFCKVFLIRKKRKKARIIYGLSGFVIIHLKRFMQVHSLFHYPKCAHVCNRAWKKYFYSIFCYFWSAWIRIWNKKIHFFDCLINIYCKALFKYSLKRLMHFYLEWVAIKTFLMDFLQ